MVVGFVGCRSVSPRKPAPVAQPFAGRWTVFADRSGDSRSAIGCSVEARQSLVFDRLPVLRAAVGRYFGLKVADLSTGGVLPRQDGSAQVEFHQRFQGNDIVQAGIVLSFSAAGHLTYYRETFVPEPAELVKPALPADLDGFIRNATRNTVYDDGTTVIREGLAAYALRVGTAGPMVDPGDADPVRRQGCSWSIGRRDRTAFG
jgi:hypothetical protein